MSDALHMDDPQNPAEVTFINTFHTVDHKDQEKLLQSLIQVTKEVIRYQPGFLSAQLHQSTDGLTVTNFARWRSTEDFKHALATPGMLAHREVLRGLYPREGYLGQIVYRYDIEAEENFTAKHK